MEASNAIVSNGSDKQEGDEWVIGSGRNRVLRFTCNALSCPTSSLPAEKLHMTFKSLQAEIKLLSFLLMSHGFHEVCEICVHRRLLWFYIIIVRFHKNFFNYDHPYVSLSYAIAVAARISTEVLIELLKATARGSKILLWKEYLVPGKIVFRVK